MEQDKLNLLSGYASKLLRKNFGRGPQSCQSTACGHFIFIYVRGFISPMEEILLKEGKRNEVEKARAVIVNHLVEELKGVIKVAFEGDVEEFYTDWNLPNNSGMILFVLEKAIAHDGPQHDMDLKGIEAEVSRISEIVQKVPDRTLTHVLSASVCLAEREGILIPIEKALISKGFEDQLLLTKDELEKSYFHRQGVFDHLFQSPVRDIFIDWNFKADKSFIAFVVNKPPEVSIRA